MARLKSSEVPQISEVARHLALDPGVQWYPDAITYSDMPNAWVFRDDHEPPRFAVVSEKDGALPDGGKVSFVAVGPMPEYAMREMCDDPTAKSMEVDDAEMAAQMQEFRAVYGEALSAEVEERAVVVSALANTILSRTDQSQT